jgi:hypothetical protein
LLKFRFKKIKKIKNNFLKILVASLAILNLFTSDLLVKANESDTKILERKFQSLIQKNREKINNDKKLTFNKLKTLKYISFGILAFVAVRLRIKRYNKHTEDVYLVEESLQEKNAEWKKAQQAEWEKTQRKEKEARLKRDQLLAEIREWLKDICEQDEIRRGLISNANIDKEIILNFITFFIKTVHSAKKLLGILRKGLNFEHYESSGKITVIDTNATFDLNYPIPSKPDGLKRTRAIHKRVGKAFGNLECFFYFFVIIFNALVKTFKLNCFGNHEGYENLILGGYEWINGDYIPIFKATGYKIFFEDINFMPTMLTTHFSNQGPIDDLRYMLEKIYHKEKTLYHLERLEKVLYNLKINSDISAKDILDILLFFVKRSGMLRVYDY